MAENDVNYPAIGKPRPFHFDWVFPLFFRPRATLQKVTESHRGAWQTPMLLLTMLLVIHALVAGPIRKSNAMSQPPQLPQGFEYYTPDQQAQFMASQQSQSGPLFTYVFPAVGNLIGLWVEWLLLGSILHLLLTLMGSRSNSGVAMNLAAWASLPFAIRLLVQTGGMLVNHQLIVHPGLSGFIADGSSGGLAFVYAMLKSVDIYLVWQMVLLVVGAILNSGLKPTKVIMAVLISEIILLALMALPGFLGAQLSGLNTIRPFFF